MAAGAADQGAEQSEDGAGGVVTVEFDVTGDVAFSGSATVGPLTHDGGVTPLSCAEYAEGRRLDEETLVFQVPGVFLGLVDNKDVLAVGGMSEYRGPGEYVDEEVTGVFTDPAVTVDGTVFELSKDDPTTTLIVQADGGGSWSFPHLEVLNDASGQKGSSISGTMIWTCED